MTNSAPPQPRQIPLALADALARGCRLHDLTTLRDLYQGGRMRYKFFLDLIDAGSINCAFNVGRKNARREVRVWWSEVQAIITGETLSHTFTDLGTVIADILPGLGNRPAQFVCVTSADLQRAFGCSADLLSDLIDDGEFKVVKPPGKPVSAVISYTSAVEFLRRRKL